MEKIILKTIKPNRFGKTITIANKPVQINSEGMIETEDKDFAKLLKEKYGFMNPNDVPKPKGKVEIKEDFSKLKKENEELKTQIEALKVEIESLKKEEPTEQGFEAEIKQKTKRELIELCEEMNFPKEDWEKLNAGDLKNYIIEVVNSSEK